MKEKVILAYSGGLDTTAIIPWLKETYGYEVICCCVDCGQEEELNGLDGVQTATVDFEKESATVSFDKTVLNPEKLTKVVEATADGKSYKVSNMKI